MRDDYRAAHGETGEVDEHRGPGPRHLFLKDHLLDQRGTSAAVLARPGDAAPACFVKLPLPRLAVRHPLVQGFRFRSRRIVLQPLAQLRAKLLFFRRIRQIHDSALGNWNGPESSARRGKGSEPAGAEGHCDYGGRRAKRRRVS